MARTIDSDKDAALAELRLNVQPDIAPVVEATELDEVLDTNQLASFWLPNTVYNVRDTILPATLNGHRYRCISAGISGATEPNWPKSNAATISDGTDGLRWQEEGPEYPNVFHIDFA